MIIHVDQRSMTSESIDKLVKRFPDINFVLDADASHEAEAIFAMPYFFKEKRLKDYPHLKWIQNLAAGYDKVELEYIRKRGIIFCNARDVYSTQIAEDVFAKILDFNRHLYTYHQQMPKGDWRRHQVHHEIARATVGIIGTGSIASAVAKRMQAFEATVLGYRRRNEPVPYFDDIYTDRQGLLAMLSRSDYVIVTAALNDDTRHVLDDEAFDHMKANAFVVNIARGELIDQDALVRALASKKIAGAGLDVTTPEPLPPDHPLWQFEQVLITPHASSESPYVHERLDDLVHENLSRYLHDERLLNIIDE